MAAAPGFAELRAELEALRGQTAADVKGAEAKARREADPEKARYPVVETAEQEAEQRAILSSRGLGTEQINKKIAKFKKKGGKIKTSAHLLKVGRILGDTLAGYNPRGYQPGQPTAQLTEQHRARIETAGAIARQQAQAAGDQEAQLLLTEAQYGLEQTAKLAKEERDRQRKLEDQEWELVSRDRMVARDLGIPDYMGDIQVIRDQITAARLADAQMENTVQQLELKYAGTRQTRAELGVKKDAVDLAQAKTNLRETPGKEETKRATAEARLKSAELTVEAQEAQRQERIDDEIAEIKGETTDPVEQRAIRAETRKAMAKGRQEARADVAMFRTMTPEDLIARNAERREKGQPEFTKQSIANMVLMGMESNGLVEYDDEGNPVPVDVEAGKILTNLARILQRLFPDPSL
jgi:hypothetical protein